MKIASIDIGSNTVLLLLAEIDSIKKTFSPLLNVYGMPRISKGLNESNIISKPSLDDLHSVLREYESIIQKHQCTKVIVNATQALRIAQNSDKIISDIKNEFGMSVNIISGNEEAYLSFLGARSGFHLKSTSIVIDIGGASSEIVIGDSKNISFQKSFPVGVVTLTEKYLQSPLSEQDFENLEQFITEMLEELKHLDSIGADVIAVSGTPTTLACAKQKLVQYSDVKVEGFVLNQKDLFGFISEFKSMTSSEILKQYGKIMQGREDIILAGTVILYNILTLLNKDHLYTSGRGLRYGAVIDFMNSIKTE